MVDPVLRVQDPDEARLRGRPQGTRRDRLHYGLPGSDLPCESSKNCDGQVPCRPWTEVSIHAERFIVSDRSFGPSIGRETLV